VEGSSQITARFYYVYIYAIYYIASRTHFAPMKNATLRIQYEYLNMASIFNLTVIFFALCFRAMHASSDRCQLSIIISKKVENLFSQVNSNLQFICRTRVPTVAFV
jgi:hypothetical protein